MPHGLTPGQTSDLKQLVTSFGEGSFTLGQFVDLKGGDAKEREPCQKSLDALIECGCVALVQGDSGRVLYNCTPQSVATGGA